jgi:hypothetical protein
VQSARAVVRTHLCIGASKSKEHARANTWTNTRQGLCSKGEDCKFLHTAPAVENRIACKFLIAGHCMQGQACRYSHDLSRVPCKYHHAGTGCGRKDSNPPCPFKHSALDEEEKEWVLRQWQLGSKEHVALLAQARKTEREAQARVADGEEQHVELSQREMGSISIGPGQGVALGDEPGEAPAIDWV